MRLAAPELRGRCGDGLAVVAKTRNKNLLASSLRAIPSARISTGDALEQDLDVPVIRDLSPRRATCPPPRRTRLFRLGLLSILAASVTHRLLPLPRRLAPDPLLLPPAVPPSPDHPHPTSPPLPLYTYP